MEVELISYHQDLDTEKRLELTTNLINQSRADLIMFCGYTIADKSDLKKLSNNIENEVSTVLFEVDYMEESKFLELNHCLYIIQNGAIHNLFTNQFFATSDEIEGNESLCERFINELETRRRFKVKRRNCLVFQCGEINIIKNLQKEGNIPVFRLQKRKDLEERFNNLLDNTDIILNPIHTPMGNQGKMEKRREYFSANNRFYFSASQNGTITRNDSEYEISMESSCLQYAFYNGNAIEESDYESTEEYQKRTYKL